MTDDSKYILLWRNKCLTVDAESFEDMVAKLQSAAAELAAMLATGKVALLPDGIADDYAHLTTDDVDVAEKYGFQEAKEFWSEDEDTDIDPDEDDDFDDFDDDEDLDDEGFEPDASDLVDLSDPD